MTSAGLGFSCGSGGVLVHKLQSRNKLQSDLTRRSKAFPYRFSQQSRRTMDENHLSQLPYTASPSIFNIPDQTVLRSPFPRHVFQGSAARSSAFTPPKANHTSAFTPRNNSPTTISPNHDHFELSQHTPPSAALPMLLRPTPMFPQITVSPSSFFGDRNSSLSGTLHKSTEFNAAAAAPHHSWNSPFELDLNGVTHAPPPVQGFSNGHEHIPTFPITAHSLSVEYDKTQMSIDQLYNSAGGAQNGLGSDSAAKEKFEYLSMTSPMPKIVDQVRLNVITPQTTFKIPPSPQHINGSVHRPNFNSSASTPPLQTMLSRSSTSPMYRTPKQPSVRELNFMYTASGNSSAQFFPPTPAYPKTPASENGYSLPRSVNGNSSVDPAHLAYESRENNRTKPNLMNGVAASASTASAVSMTKNSDAPEEMEMGIDNSTTALATDFGGPDDAYETDITAAQTYSGLEGMGSTDMYQTRIPPGFALPPPRLPHVFTNLVSYDPHPSDDEQGNSNEQGNNNEFEEFVNLSPHVGAEDAFYSPARKFGELQRGSSPEPAGVSNGIAKDNADVVIRHDEEPIEKAAEVSASANSTVADSPALPVPTPSLHARVVEKNTTFVAKEPDKMETKMLDSDVTHLVQWRLKTGVRQEESVILVSGLHIDSKKQLKSNEIVERIDAHTLRSCTGKIYRITGHPDVQEMLSRGISYTLCEAFRDGFPENWKQLVWDELENIGRSSAISSPAMKTPSRSEAMSSDLWDANTSNGRATRLPPLSATAKRLKLAQETPTRYNRRRDGDVVTGNVSRGKSPVLTSMGRKLAVVKEDVVDITPSRALVPSRRNRERVPRPRPLRGSSNGNVIVSRNGNKLTEGDFHGVDDEADGEEDVVDTTPQKISTSSLRNKEWAPRSRLIKKFRMEDTTESEEKPGHEADGETEDEEGMIGVTPQKIPGSSGKKPAEYESCRTNQFSDKTISNRLSWLAVKAKMREVVIEIPFYSRRVVMKVKEVEETPHGETMIETEHQGQTEDQGTEEASDEEANIEEASAEEVDAKEVGAKEADAKKASGEATDAKEADTKETSGEATDAEAKDAEEADAKKTSTEVADAEIADAEEAGAEEAGAKEASTEAANAEESNAEEAGDKEASTEVANAEEADDKEARAEVANAEEADAKETDAEEANAEEANAEEANAEEAGDKEVSTEVVNEADAEEADAEEADAEEADAEEADAEEANAEEADAEEADAKKMSTEVADAEEADTEEVGTGKVDVKEVAAKETAAEEASTEEAGTEEAGTEEAGTEEASTEKADAEEADAEEADAEEADVEETSPEEEADAEEAEAQLNLGKTRDGGPAEAESVATFGEKQVIAEEVVQAGTTTDIEALNEPMDNTPAGCITEDVDSAKDDVQPARPDDEDISGNSVNILPNPKRIKETERKANFTNLPKTRRHSVGASEDGVEDANIEDEPLTNGKRKAPRRTVKEHSEPPRKRKSSVQIKTSPATRSGRNVKPPAAWWEVKLESKSDIKGKENPVKKKARLGRPQKERVGTPSLLLSSRSQDTVSIMVESSRVESKDEEPPTLTASEFTLPIENDERIRLLENSENGHELREDKLEKTVRVKNSVPTKDTNDKLPKRKQKKLPCLKEGRRRRKSGRSAKKEQLKNSTNEEVNEDEVLVEDHGETSHDTAPKEATEEPVKEKDRKNDDWDFENIYGEDDDPKKLLLAQARMAGSSKEFADSGTYDPYDPDTYFNEVTAGNGIRPGTPVGKKPRIFQTPASSKRPRQRRVDSVDSKVKVLSPPFKRKHGFSGDEELDTDLYTFSD